MPNWTPEQKKAIDSRDGTILVSAAAGSGKTAVLVERVLKRLTDESKPCSADRLLIVTFTRVATRQMKERIFKALSTELKNNPDNSHLKHQLVMLPFADISTIDSFCNNVVRENFHETDISPDYHLLEDAQLKIMRYEAAERTIEEFYKENSPEFIELVNILSSATHDDVITEIIRSVYDNSMAFAQPEKWLDKITEPYENYKSLSESEWGQIIINYTCEGVEYCKSLCKVMTDSLKNDEVVKEKYSVGVNEIELTLNELGELLKSGDWDSIRKFMLGVKFGTIGRLPKGYSSYYADCIKSCREEVKSILKKLGEFYCASEEENREDMEYLCPVVKKLISCVKRYGEILFEEKKKINSYEFSDITHFALDMLIKYDENGNPVKTELARSYAEKYDEILVDEYQDINDLQKTLFWAVSNDENNLFMVGDVKQSIYRFRQAMPEIFLKRRNGLEDYTDGNYPAKITLDRNFRSRSGVTDNINFVFSQLMSERMGGIDYNASEALMPAADYNTCDFSQVEYHIIGSSDDYKVSREIEAQHIADTINNIIANGMQVRDGDGYRNAEYKDFCILMRSTSNGKAELYADVLARNMIPAHVSNKIGFFEASEISTMLNLMCITDNPMQDIPLLSVMLSPIFGFTANDLAKLRVEERKKPLYRCVVDSAESGDEKCKKFLALIDELRMLSATLPCSEFVREMYNVTGYKAFVLAMKNGTGRVANLNLLVDYAEKYEKSGRRGLSGFVRFIEKVQQQKAELESASEVSESANVVKIMTIHKSKGLEFPICILADTNNKFNQETGTAVFHPDYGICFDRRDSRIKCKYSTVGRKALVLAEKESSYSEELRVLYVALTRAKERLICVSRYDNIDDKLSKFAYSVRGQSLIKPFVILNKTCMADWLLLAFLRHPDACKLRNIEGVEMLKCDASLKVDIFTSVDKNEDCCFVEEKCSADDALLEEIKKRTEYVYPYSSLSRVCAKIAPSDIDETEFSTEYFAAAKPTFLSKSGFNPATKGTAMHKFMEFYDYKSVESDIDSQIERMVCEHHITPDEAKILEKNELNRFFNSDIAKRIRKSSLLLREKKVTVGIRAGDLYDGLSPDEANETVMVQGYVDCAFEENNGLVIVDYKTDKNVDEDTLRRRYGRQLKLYEYALHECTGMKIIGTLIYSFDSGCVFEL